MDGVGYVDVCPCLEVGAFHWVFFSSFFFFFFEIFEL